MRMLYLHDKNGDVIVNMDKFVYAYNSIDGGPRMLLDAGHYTELIEMNETPAEIAAMIEAMA